MKLIVLAVVLMWCQFSQGQTADSTVVTALRQAGVTFSYDNSVVPMNTAREKYHDMFAAIRQAKSSVHLEYFNFRNDSIANALFDLLVEKAEQGVEVRAMYDSFGNSSNNRPLKSEHIKYLRQHGVEIYEVDPIKFPWFNHMLSRDHRKIVVIDGQIAYIGGMNVADYYIHGKPEIGAWHDMHCRLDGSAVNELQTIFLRMWNKTARQNVGGAKYYRSAGASIQGGCKAVINDTATGSVKTICKEDKTVVFEGLKSDTTVTAYHKMVGIINREPHVTNRIMRQFYIAAIDGARDSIKIINPYFTLVHSVKRALRRALHRGVKVEVLISEKCDIPVQPDVSFRNFHSLMKHGANAYIYKGGFHHTKVIMVDGRVCTIGSCNLDARSLSWDYECNAVIIDRYTTAELCRLFEEEKHQSFRLTPEVWKTWPGRKSKFIGWFFQIINRFL